MIESVHYYIIKFVHKYVDVYRNQLSALDVSQNPSLTYLYCANNQLSTLDVSQNPSLTRLECRSEERRVGKEC